MNGRARMRAAVLHGREDVRIERFPQSARQWDGEMGELVMGQLAEFGLKRWHVLHPSLARAKELAGRHDAHQHGGDRPRVPRRGDADLAGHP